MPVERILEAEKRVECKTEHQVEFEVKWPCVLNIIIAKESSTVDQKVRNYMSLKYL
jgi:hypothetical protein